MVDFCFFVYFLFIYDDLCSMATTVLIPVFYIFCDLGVRSLFMLTKTQM